MVPTSSDIDQNGRALQAAIDEAQYGDCVLVPPGVVYRVGSLMLRYKSGDGWITIKSAATDTTLPPQGLRVGPSNANSMPMLISPGGNAPAVLTEPGAHNYRLIGLEITKADPSAFVQEMVVIDAQFGQDASASPSLNNFPSNIIIDRCYIHGLPGSDLKRTIRFHCSSCAVVDSYLSDAHVIGQDSQAIMFGGRTIKIANNYLEAAGENLFAADYHTLQTGYIVGHASLSQATLSSTVDLEVGMGIAFYDGKTNLYTTVRSISGSTITFDPLAQLPPAQCIAYWGLIPTDVEIVHNYMYKPLSWNSTDPSYAGYHPSVKNLFELKSGRRIWVHNNVLENTWTDAQSGYAVLFTVRNEQDQCYFCAVEDVTFESNVIRNANFGMNMLATDYNYPSGPTRRILIRNNEWIKIKSSFQVNSLSQLTIDHNTAVIGGFAEEVEDGAIRSENVSINNMIVSTECSGFHYGSPDVPNWVQIFPGWTLQANVMSNVNGMPPYLYMLPSVAAANYGVGDATEIGFIDYANENFALSPTSPYKGRATDQQDIGADVPSLMKSEGYIKSGSDDPGASAAASGDGSAGASGGGGPNMN